MHFSTVVRYRENVSISKDIFNLEMNYQLVMRFMFLRLQYFLRLSERTSIIYNSKKARSHHRSANFKQWYI